MFVKKIRLLFLLLPCLFAVPFTFAENLDGNMNKAMDLMQRGYVEHAVSMIRHSASTNNLLAQYYMAQCYEYGIGVEVDLSMAFGMYRRAAERGLRIAMKDMSRLYATGIGVNKSIEKAEVWNQRYSQKAESGPIPDLVTIYNEGIKFNGNYSLNLTNQKIEPCRDGVAVSETAVIQRVEIVPVPPLIDIDKTKEVEESKLRSDVDYDIPVSSNVNEQTFAFIIANENYQEVSKVSHALNDGAIVAEYCVKTLGLPAENVHLVKDATLNNMRRELNLMKQIASAYRGDASFIVYYAGHGVPDEGTRKAYLLPVDGFAGDLSTCYSLNDFYATLGQLPVKRNMVFIDACFSGATRANEMLVAARGVVIAPKEDRPTGNTFILSSSQGNETSYSFDEKQHGLFTYYLLKKIKESRGDVTLSSLVDYVKDNVTKKSIVVNSKSQTPSVNISSNIRSCWEHWTLK